MKVLIDIGGLIKKEEKS